MRFAAAPEYHVFPTLERPLTPYQAVVRAVRDTRPLVAETRPHAIVADILTLAPALAGELEGVPVATLIPHLDPRGAPGFPPYSIGARLPRTRAGRRMWAATDRVVAIGLERGREELNETRGRLGLPPLAHVHGGISRDAVPRRDVPAARVSARLAGRDPRRRPAALGAAVGRRRAARGRRAARARRAVDLAGPPAAPPARRARGPGRPPRPRPRRARTAARSSRRCRSRRTRGSSTGSRTRATMPRCDVVVSHAGHGTLARALAGRLRPGLRARRRAT